MESKIRKWLVHGLINVTVKKHFDGHTSLQNIKNAPLLPLRVSESLKEIVGTFISELCRKDYKTCMVTLQTKSIL